MSQILNRVRDVDPNNSDAVKEALSSFFLNLAKHTDLDSNRWLRSLENIITRFPKYCGSHRTTIESYLTVFIDSNNYYNVIEAAKCAHALQQVRPSQDKTATPKACWKEHLNALCIAAQKLIGALFPNSVDIYKGTSSAQKLRLQSSTTSPLYMALEQITTVPKNQNNINKQVVLGTKLKNIFVFIQASLVEIFPVAKPIQPQFIVELIVRALSVSSGAKQSQDVSKAISVKIQALNTLNALIACLGSNLLPFSALIFKFVILTLKWCSENLSEESREVRRSAYDSLRRWLSVLHTYRLADSPRGRGWEDELAQHIINDITPLKHVVQLTMSSQPTKRLSKKAKRKLANTMLQESSLASHSPGEKNKVHISEEANDDIAVAALDCAETFLNVCGVFMKPTTHKLFQERLVRECYNVDAHSARALGLLRVLDALRKNTPSTVPPPTQYCLQLYSGFCNSQVEAVSKFCSQALLDIRLHLHCSPPSLNFALEVQSAPKKANQPKKMSSQNRAALEALLGSERLPGKRQEDTIDIQDAGPSSKKPKLDDNVADEISVSSETVEISDDSEEESDDDDVQEVALVSVEDSDTEKINDPQEDVVDAGESNSAPESQAKANLAAENEKESILSCAKDESPVIQNKDELQHSQPKHSDKTEESSSAIKESVTLPRIYETNDKIINVDNIHEAATQIALNTSGDSVEEPHSSNSMEVEVACDFPKPGDTKVTLLDKIDDDNLPSTNDTDDVPITCGQMHKGSQELDIEKNSEIENKENEVPKVNGDSHVEKTGANVVKATEIVSDKITGIKDVSVEDMLADFVDEISEENKTEV